MGRALWSKKVLFLGVFLVFLGGLCACNYIPVDILEISQEEQLVAESAKLEEILTDWGSPLGRNRQRFEKCEWPIEMAMYQCVGDRAFYWEDDFIKSYDFSTAELRIYDLIPVKKTNIFQWLVSGDGKMVAWVEEISYDYDTSLVEVVIYVADLESGKKIEIKESGDLEIAVLANFADSSTLYFGKQRTELGGRFVFHYLMDLYKLETHTGEVELILERELKRNCKGEYVSCLAEDGTLVAYFQNNTLLVRELSTGKETSIALPDFGGISIFGGSTFSEDKKTIEFTYLTFLEKEDQEIYRHVVVDWEEGIIELYPIDL